MNEKYSSLNNKLLNNKYNIGYKKIIDDEKTSKINRDSEDDFKVFYSTNNNKYNQIENNRNEKKGNKLITFNSEKAGTTNDNTDHLYPEQESKSNNILKHKNKNKISYIHIDDEKINYNSIKRHYINNNNINLKNKKNTEKHQKISKNVIDNITTLNMNSNNNSCDNYIVNGYDNKEKQKKLCYFKFSNEEIILEDITLNQSILYINKKQNYYLKTLFEKLIMKKDEYSTYKRKKLSLSLMLFFIIIYFFCCCTLLIANCQAPEIIDSKYNVPFHMLDFWGSFGFALIEAAILVTAAMVEIGSLRHFIVSVNIGTTLIAAVLFSFNPEFWEINCHWIEFSAQIFITLSDILFIFHQFKKAEYNILYKYRYYELGLVLFFAMAAVIKLLVFGGVINLGIDPEQAAHFFEYCGEMVNAIFAFVFTLVMYKECNQNLNAIFDYTEIGKELGEEPVAQDI